MAMFWRYSPFNAWVIRRQRPGATRVAGRRLWEKLGRTVLDGEDPIFIFAPTRAAYRFIAVPVFDEAQTSGSEIPTLDLLHLGPTDAYLWLEAGRPASESRSPTSSERPECSASPARGHRDRSEPPAPRTPRRPRSRARP